MGLGGGVGAGWFRAVREGFHARSTAQGIDWSAEMGDHGDEDVTDDLAALRVDGGAIHPKADYALLAKYQAPLNPEALDPPVESFRELRAMLVENYYWLHSSGHVSHPRGRRFTRLGVV
jgi:hypothetical protein